MECSTWKLQPSTYTRNHIHTHILLSFSSIFSIFFCPTPSVCSQFAIFSLSPSHRLPVWCKLYICHCYAICKRAPYLTMLSQDYIIFSCCNCVTSWPAIERTHPAVQIRYQCHSIGVMDYVDHSRAEVDGEICCRFDIHIIQGNQSYEYISSYWSEVCLSGIAKLTRPTLKLRQTLGRLRSIYPYMINRFASQSKTC